MADSTPSSSTASTAANAPDKNQAKVKDLVSRYYKQLTMGCGRKCQNLNCFDCEDFVSLDPNEAALTSLRLAQGTEHHFCEDDPAFLEQTQLTEKTRLVHEQSQPHLTDLINLLTEVFKQSSSLKLSFLCSEKQLRVRAEKQTKEQGRQIPWESYLGLDMEFMEKSFASLAAVDDAAGGELWKAVAGSIETLMGALPERTEAPPPKEEEVAWLRQWVILLHCPFLLEPLYHEPLLLSLYKEVARLWDSSKEMLVELWKTCSVSTLTYLKDVCQQFITIRLFQIQRIDEGVQAATKVLHMVYMANQQRGAIDFTAFYNDAVNGEVNLKEDYRRWQSRREFTFCQYPFILEPSSKSRVLMYDATAQMTTEFEGAILRSLFVGATSPYLVLKVRRDNLITDTLLQVSLRHEDLKKPLKVQFSGEEGIDEGGVQKEFFQCIIRQIFDINYGMYTYDEETRTFWFNPNSLENEREFELIGILLGVAIYNGIILDIHFPHVVYKKLMQEAVTLEDLKKAFPTLGRSLQQLLDYEEAPDGKVEDVFSQTFAVSYDVFGEIVTVPLKEGGEDVPVTSENRQEYVECYTEYTLNRSIERQFNSFSRGFHLVCGGQALDLFRWEELELLICGSPNLDFKALETVTQYDDGYTKEHSTIQIFWEVIHQLSMEEQKRFLMFATGSDRVPIKGLGNLNFIISRNGSDEQRLPSAHTCFNHLLLPEYTSTERLKSQLLKAISNTEGFHMI